MTPDEKVRLKNRTCRMWFFRATPFFLELHNLDCSDVSEAEIDYFLACQAAMQLGMEDESDSSDY